MLVAAATATLVAPPLSRPEDTIDKPLKATVKRGNGAQAMRRAGERGGPEGAAAADAGQAAWARRRVEQAGTGVPDPHRARRVDENSFLDLSERGGATTGLVHMPLSESVTDEAMPTLYAMPSMGLGGSFPSRALGRT